MIVTQTKSYLCESVLVQKALTKPGNFLGGSSQGVSAMERHEVASQRYSEGWRVGLNDMRVPATRMKHETLTPVSLLRKEIRLSLSAYQVRGAVIWRKWHCILTSEVPRRLCSQQSKRGP